MHASPSKPDTKSFISIGPSRGVTLTSLNSYDSENQKIDDFQLNSSLNMSTNDDDAETIASLQREQSRLTEELDAERRRSESLKSTFTKSLSQATAFQREKLLVLKGILESEPDNSFAKEALKHIGNIEEKEKNAPVNTPKINELARRAKEVEKMVEKQHLQNQKLKETARAARDEIAQMRQQLEDINAQIEEAVNSHHELKQKSKSISATAKKRDATWKERVAQLEAQLLELGWTKDE